MSENRINQFLQEPPTLMAVMVMALSGGLTLIGYRFAFAIDPMHPVELAVALPPALFYQWTGSKQTSALLTFVLWAAAIGGAGAGIFSWYVRTWGIRKRMSRMVKDEFEQAALKQEFRDKYRAENLD